MIKVFISQPMNGKSKDEILCVKNKAITSVKTKFCDDQGNDDVEIIDSYFEDYNPDNGCIPLKYLAKSLELLADADVAYFAKGWEEARECKIENAAALAYGITFIEDYTDE